MSIFKSIFRRNQFNTDVAILSLGTILGQGINLAASPIITRIYTPGDLGLLALFMGVISVGGVIATGRYEQAILLPKKEEIAHLLLKIALILTVVVAFFSLPIFFGVSKFFYDLPPKGMFYLYSISLLFIGIYQSYTHWFNRIRKYALLAFNKVLLGISSNLIMIGLGVLSFGSLGLIFGFLFGQLIATIHLFIRKKKNEQIHFGQKRMKVVARRYLDFPKFKIPAKLMNDISFQAPIFLLTSFFDLSVVGFFALSHRVVRLPLSIIGGSIGAVFFQKASEDFAQLGNCKEIFDQTAKKLLLIAFPIFLLIIVLAPTIFAFVFGNEWREAGVYVQLLAAMSFFQFINAPLSRLFIIAEKQRSDLIWQMIFFSSSIISLSVGYFLFNDARLTLLLYSVSQALVFIGSFFATRKFAQGNLASLN